MLNIMLNIIKNLLSRIINFLSYQSLFFHVEMEIYINALKASERFTNEKRLLRYEYQVFSQSGEDGIIHEIFVRIGVSNKFFVEFGGDGTYNNSTNLLFNQWQGLWIESDSKLIRKARNNFKKFLETNKLHIDKKFVTPQNIEEIFENHSVPEEFDFLCIDIDNNDYYVWEAIKAYKPRCVVIEYNASLGPDNSLVVPYSLNAWEYDNCFGASLKALESLASKKGYLLVGCNSSGVNAFFVRSDLVGDKFHSPFTSLEHFEPPRYFLTYRQNGHKKRNGAYVYLNIGKG